MTGRPSDPRAAAWRRWARDLLRVRRTGFDGVDAVRAGTCAGVVVLIGWWFGNVAAGLTASIGAFTALFGAGRPYRSRAVQLALIAVALAAVVMLGAWSESSRWVAVVVVAAVAVVATWLCQACDTGPPGAYMIVLAAATASSITGADTEVWRLGLLVLAGGALSWLAHMLGVVGGLRRPEKATVRAGGAAVGRLLDAVGCEDHAAARDAAARAMHRCWVVLGGRRVTDRADGTAVRLRSVALGIHGVMAEAIRAHDEGRPPGRDAGDRLRAWLAAVNDPAALPDGPGARVGAVPWGGPGAAAAAREMLAAGSPWRPVLVRVGLAALVAGAVGSVVGLDHAYWAVASAVLVLCQGLGWAGTLERAVLRLLGTWVGLLLAAVLLSAQPAGVWLAVTVAALQCAVQLAVPRNYGLGVVVITPLALTIGSAGHPADLGALLLARGVDTAVGCAIGVLVFLAVRPGATVSAPAVLVAGTLRDAARVVPHLVDRSTTSDDARRARSDLNQHLLALADAHQVGDLAAPVRRTRDATIWWPALDEARRVGHQVLAACWSQEAAPSGGPPSVSASRATAIGSEMASLAALADPAGTSDGPGRDAAGAAEEPGFLVPELAALRTALPVGPVSG
ncbi:FUSC family protein [Actinomycetospora endophytica]|uniref:FUSC family protein n=1 Tax=Actinomycetospora endophytica TaxID=2291215 RepID=A0ABS8PJM0_9PSEU|nr:FUSC family protein [Actinomycetospora endophytica]MCD2198127.1 FUSC family protein [Actinomycetospora endophytica]